MAQSNASQSYTCALSGLSPLTDPIVTPSGYICSRKLLLTKLSENGGVDPFDSQGKRSLDESQLIDLALSSTNGSGGEAAPIPPRPPKATSLPSLLTLMRDEFDAVLLELYDTRKALEETRRELSSALYQNDAAVRVVARILKERDEARAKLEEFLREGVTCATAAAGGAVQKRGRDEEQQEAQPTEEPTVEAPPKKAKTSTEKSTDKIPPTHLEAMVSTWKTLSKFRKVQTKQNKKSEEQLASYESVVGKWTEVKKVNLHKSSAKAGVLSLSNVTVDASVTNLEGEYLISGGHDKQAIVYNVADGTIMATVGGGSADIVTVCGRIVEGSTMLVSTGSSDGMVRLHSIAVGEKDAEPTLVGSISVDGSPVVATVIHPSSTKDCARVIVQTQDGMLALVVTSSSDEGLEMVFQLKHESKYSVGAMHPDGLIFAAGTVNGKILIWDLRTQALAGTLECTDEKSVGCIAFSENGYHVATSSSEPSSSIQIWDLRKLKSIATINPNAGDDDSSNIGRIASVAFDPSGVFLAYSGEDGAKICVVKDTEKVVCTLVPSKSGRKSKRKEEDAFFGGIVFGGVGDEKIWCASGCDGERPLRVWGME